MYSFKNDLSKNEYDNFINNYSMTSFMQEYNWSNIKENWDSFHCGLYKNSNLIGVCLILVKRIWKNIKFFYIPRGYLIDFTNYNDLKAMTDSIKTLAKKNHAYMVKIDPNFCISDNGLKGIDVEHNYSKDYTVKNNNLLKLGYKNTGLHKEMKKNIQPQFNMFAPLCNLNSEILNEEEILKNYKSKFKYYLGSFHEKRGVFFEITNDENRISDLVKMIKLTEEKQNIHLRNEEYFKKIIKNYKERAYLVFGYINPNIYLNYLESNNGKEEEIDEIKTLKKENDNKILLSAALMLLPNNKKGIRTSEYLYAGNNTILKKLNVSPGVVWEIIKFSIKNKCHYCNLGGVDGNLKDPLSIFKEKYNARLMVFCGEYDLPTSWIYYPIKLVYPILIKIYKMIK